MQLTFISMGSLIIIIFAIVIASCGEQPGTIPASGATPKSTLTVIAIPPTYDTRTPPITPTTPGATPSLTTAQASPPTTKEASPSSPSVSGGRAVQDYDSLLDNLRSQNAIVNPGGTVTQPFFSVDGKVVSINGEDVQIFEFADATSAKTEASKIAKDGSSIGTSMVSWIGAPHFFLKERLIVLYIGSNTGVFQPLTTALGPQVAGR